MKTIIYLGVFILAFSLSWPNTVHSQGCVAIQGMGCTESNFGDSGGIIKAGEISISTGYRYFRSFRHFRGDVEERHRVENNTEVINLSHLFEFGISYALSDRMQLNLNIPLSFFDRSSLYEHYGNSIQANPEQQRFHTSSSGIGDVRLSASYWVRDPSSSTSNFQIGLGLKMPTGNAHAKDDFHKLDEEGKDFTIRRPVDQSIQLGDGGWGILIEGEGFHSIWQGKSALYFSGFYMFNPKNYNSTLRTPTSDPDHHWSYFSSPDQFGARLGISYLLNHQFSFGLGGLIEGVPATDFIGGSEGYRRPGYAISLEPSIGFGFNSWSFNASVPVALYRNRIKSVWDRERGAHGDAAFADYSINFSVSYRIGSKTSSGGINFQED